MKRKENLQNGITLISLVITIIVLLILATVAISMAVDSNGLFARARKAAEDWNKSVGDESTAIENAMLIMNQISGESASGGGTEQPPEEKDTEPPTGSYTLTCEAIKKNGTTTIVVTGEDNVEVKQIKKPDESIEEGNVARYDINAIGNYDFEIEDTSGNKITYTVKVPRLAILPEGYVASNVEGEDTIENGLVIYEGTEPVTGTKGSLEHENAMKNRNQYVWIPVDDINDMVMCQKCGADGLLVYNSISNTLKCTNEKSEENPEGHDKTKLAGKLYATVLKNNFNKDEKNQKYDANTGLREPAIVTGNDEGTGTQYDGAIDETFNLGTSEAFLNHLQTEFDNMAKSVTEYKGFYISRYEIQAGITSKKEVYPLTAGKANTWYGLYTAIQDSKDLNKGVIPQMIWGCQYDQVMKFVDGKHEYNVKLAVSERHTDSPANSGKNDKDIICNIYDLEGNLFEWTTEAYGSAERVTRGGYFNITDSASYRRQTWPNVAYGGHTSRCALYVTL